MPNKFASGKYTIAECDRCAGRYMLKDLRTEVIKTKPYRLKVCKPCWDPDHPQLQLGMYPVNDPQAVREPRPDVSYQVSGLGSDGYPSGGSRETQWNWNPVGGIMGVDNGLAIDNLKGYGYIGNVTITIS